MTLLFSFLVALALTSILVPPMMRVAPRLGLVDRPGPRKIHHVPVPLCGGLAVAAGALVPVLMWGNLELSLVLSLFAAAIIIGVGAIDDARPLYYLWRLLTQTLAVAVLLSAGVHFGDLPLFGLDMAPWWLAGPVTVLFILGCTNAVNLADGMDGLAGGLVIPSLLAIAFLAYQGEGGTVVVACAALTGAVLGFLRFNTYPASVFLGDAGSTFLGFTAATLAIVLVENCHPALNPAIVLLLMGVPLLDTLYAVVRRLASGKSPFKADRRHMHHQLLDLGLPQVGAVAALYLIQGVMVVTGVTLRYESDAVVLGSFAVIAFAVIVPLAQLSQSHAPAGAGEQTETLWARLRPFQRRGLGLTSLDWLPALSLAMVKFGLSGFILAAAIVPTAISRDVAVVAACVTGLWLLKLIAMPRRSLPLHRLLVYAAAGFAAYVVVTTTAGQPMLGWMVAAYLGLLTVALIIAIRVSRRGMFQVTPLDLLVLFLALTVPNLSSEAVGQYHVREIIAVLIVLFYASEFVLVEDENSRLGLDVAALLSLGLLGIRGFV